MPGEYGALILLRHGQSTANAQGLFTGLLNVPLTSKGIGEAHAAATLLNQAHLRADVVFTSALARSVRTAEVVMTDLARLPGEVTADWRVNERNYGGLTGRSKHDVLEQYGEEQFLQWRRSVNTAPPPMSDELFDELAASQPFRSLPAAALTRTESLRDVIRRVRDFYEDGVVAALLARKTVLLIAHGNSLRALCAILDELSDDAVRELNIPTGQPLIYEFDRKLRPTNPGGRYLDDASAQAAAAALAREGGT